MPSRQQVIDNFLEKMNEEVKIVVKKYVNQIAYDTSAEMNNAWAGGKNWNGETWAKLSDGEKCYLDLYGDMRRVTHYRALERALWEGKMNYREDLKGNELYPKANMYAGSYAELHQTGSSNARGAIMPQRKWHPEDFENYTDFNQTIVQEADADGLDFYARRSSEEYKKAVEQIVTEDIY